VSQYFQIHPQNPQGRLIQQAAEILRHGGVIAYPTDSCYALGCHIGDKAALERIRRIRCVEARHNFTLVCRDLSEIATYAKVDNTAYRLLRALTPGPYTFILQATREVPKRLQHAKRRTIGIRVPDHPIVHALLDELNQPIMSATLTLPGDDLPLTEAEDIRERLEHQLDLVIDGGHCGLQPTTVIEMVEEVPHVIRVGQGDVSLLQSLCE
jgi:tRNA threonylcarbamoyl adenosine modification protein (Sua5/YciO/YrdC/YwlC family)